MTVLQFFDTLASHPKRPDQINGGPPAGSLCWAPFVGPFPPSALPPFTLNISIFAVLFYCLKVCSSAETSASRACNLDRTYPFLLSYFIFFSLFFLLFLLFHFFSFFLFFSLSSFLCKHMKIIWAVAVVHKKHTKNHKDQIDVFLII